MEERYPLPCPHLAVATRDSPLSISGVKGNVIREAPKDND